MTITDATPIKETFMPMQRTPDAKLETRNPAVKPSSVRKQTASQNRYATAYAESDRSAARVEAVCALAIRQTVARAAVARLSPFR